MAQRNVMMQGFWYSEHSYLFEEGISCLGSWLRSGQLKEVFDMAEGFDAVPDAARGIFSGANMGKQLVHIADA
jgi:NADPH-dependent curcumin reductase CurA